MITKIYNHLEYWDNHYFRRSAQANYSEKIHHDMIQATLKDKCMKKNATVKKHRKIKQSDREK